MKFSVDLVNTALYHLEFLHEIDNLNLSQEIKAKAIYRYEKLWLPFYLKANEKSGLYPPNDIAFIWHCIQLLLINFLDF
jgi:hypothetical protein